MKSRKLLGIKRACKFRIGHWKEWNTSNSDNAKISMGVHPDRCSNKDFGSDFYPTTEPYRAPMWIYEEGQTSFRKEIS
jgi:hypothetical protein